MDNVIMTQEVIHSMRSKKGKKGQMAIKVDLEKTYDILNQQFLEDTLKEIRLSTKLILIIMAYVSWCSMRVIWNSQP